METNRLVYSITFFVVTLMMVFLFVLPRYQETVRIDLSLVKKEASLTSQSDYYEKIFKLLMDIKDRSKALDKINTALPQNFSFAPIIYFMQKTGADSGVIIRSINFSEGAVTNYGQAALATTSGKPIKEIILQVNLTGSYPALKNFIYNLEKSARLFKVNSVSFLSSPSKVRQNYDFRLEVQTHSY